MLDIRFIRENPEAVKENIKKKFQEEKLPLVDQVLALDSENRAAMSEANELRAARNSLSKQVGMLMGQAKKDPSKLAEAEEAKAKVKANADRLAELEEKEARLAEAKGAALVTLGRRILRTETAAIAAMSILMYVWGDLSGEVDELDE